MVSLEESCWGNAIHVNGPSSATCQQNGGRRVQQPAHQSPLSWIDAQREGKQTDDGVACDGGSKWVARRERLHGLSIRTCGDAWWEHSCFACVPRAHVGVLIGMLVVSSDLLRPGP